MGIRRLPPTPSLPAGLSKRLASLTSVALWNQTPHVAGLLLVRWFVLSVWARWKISGQRAPCSRLLIETGWQKMPPWKVSRCVGGVDRALCSRKELGLAGECEESRHFCVSRCAECVLTTSVASVPGLGLERLGGRVSVGLGEWNVSSLHCGNLAPASGSVRPTPRLALV